MLFTQIADWEAALSVTLKALNRIKESILALEDAAEAHEEAVDEMSKEQEALRTRATEMSSRIDEQGFLLANMSTVSTASFRGQRHAKYWIA